MGFYILLCVDRFLADEVYEGPVIIHNHPKEMKPFYVRLNEDRQTVASFDLVVPKVAANCFSF